MKTIGVVYTGQSSLTAYSKTELAKLKTYVFRTNADLKVGDVIKPQASYSSANIIVTKVIDKDFKFYNAVTGDLATEWSSSNHKVIKELVIRDAESDEVSFGSLLTNPFLITQ